MNLKCHGCMWKQSLSVLWHLWSRLERDQHTILQWASVCVGGLNEVKSSAGPRCQSEGWTPVHRPWEPSSRNKSPPLGGATVTSVCGTSAWLTAWTRRCRSNYGVLLPSDADMLINGPILVETDRGAKSVLWELLSLEMEEFDALGTAMVLSIFSVLGFLQ